MIIKNAILSMDDSDRFLASYGDYTFAPCSGAYLLTDVGFNFDHLDHYPSLDVKLDDALLQLVVLSQFIEDSLRVGELPASFVNEKLNQIEALGLQIIAASLGDLDFIFLESEFYPHLIELADDLNQFAPPPEGEWSVGGECGDGEIVAELRTDPPDGRVWLISEFDWQVCRLEGFDPNDINGCRWREETGKEFSMVAGNYHVFVQWRDGSTTRSRRSFLDEATGDKTVFLVR